MEPFGLTKLRVIMLIVVSSIVRIRADSVFNFEDFFKGMSEGLQKLDQDMQGMNQRLMRLENIVGIHESSPDENGQIVRNGQKSAEISLDLRETKRNLIKAMSVEKHILRESMHSYENKWNDFKSEVIGVLREMNTTMETSNEKLTKKIEQNAERLNTIDSDIAEMNIKHDESIKALDEMNTTIKKSKKYLTKQIEKKVKVQARRIDTNTEELSTVVKRINTIDNMVAVLDVKQDAEATKVRDLDSLIHQINSTSENTEKSLVSAITRMNEFHGTKHGFSVNLVSDKQYQPEDAIVFDRIMFNYGGSYNNLTGQFTVPQTGTYLFSFSVHGTQSNYAWGQLVYGEDNDFWYGASAKSQAGIDTTASCTWVANLSKGTKVWVLSVDSCEFYKIRTAFTGVRLD